MDETQGTVVTFDSATGSGTVVLDDGTRLAFGGPAFAPSGLRGLRLGQRVRLRTAGDGPSRQVVALTLVTLPLDR